MRSFFVKHATRKLATLAITCRRRSKNTSLKRPGETSNGAKRQKAHRPPRGKRAAWSGNQLLSKATLYSETAFLDKKLNVLKGFSIKCSDCNLSSEYGIMLVRNCSHIERKSNYET
jgi:hypothetical protein